MQCVFCKTGETRPGKTTVTLERGRAVIVVRGVPAEVCANCGEAFLSTKVAQEISDRADKAVSGGAEVEIMNYAA